MRAIVSARMRGGDANEGSTVRCTGPRGAGGLASAGNRDGSRGRLSIPPAMGCVHARMHRTVRWRGCQFQGSCSPYVSLAPHPTRPAHPVCPCAARTPACAFSYSWRPCLRRGHQRIGRARGKRGLLVSVRPSHEPPLIHSPRRGPRHRHSGHWRRRVCLPCPPFVVMGRAALAPQTTARSPPMTHTTGGRGGRSQRWRRPVTGSTPNSPPSPSFARVVALLRLHCSPPRRPPQVACHRPPLWPPPPPLASPPRGTVRSRPLHTVLGWRRGGGPRPLPTGVCGG